MHTAPSVGETSAILRVGRTFRCWIGLWIVLLVLMLVEMAAGAAVPEADAERVERLETLILEPWLDRHRLAEGLIAYQEDERILLPLGDLARLLDLAIEFDPEARRAEGWILRQNRPFLLDLEAGVVTIDGRQESFAPAEVLERDQDLFVASRKLSQWLPAEFTVDLRNLRLRVEPTEPFPLELRLARGRQRVWLEAQKMDIGLPTEPAEEVPYSLLSMPFIDFSSEVALARGTGRTRSLDGRYSLLFTGDFAYMSGRAFLSGSTTGDVSQARLTLGRSDPDAELLGPLRATRFEFGDVLSPSLPLLTRARQGRGLAISNYPLHQPTEFDRTTFTGDLPVGWEVELYRNDVLLDFQTDRTDGRFEFPDVLLVFGVNEFRLVFYGPQGQVREEVETIVVGTELVPRGEHRYRFSAMQQQKSLIGPDEAGFGVSRPGGVRSSAEYEVGLADGISLAARALSLPLRDGRHHYGSLGARATLGRLFGAADIITDGSGGWAGEGVVQTRLAGISLLAEQAFFSDFRSERENASLADSVRSRSRLRADGTLPLAGMSLGYSLGAEHERLASGGHRTSLTNRLSTRLFGVAASNTLSLNLNRRGATRDSRGHGRLLLSGRPLGGVWLRGAIDYDFAPEPALRGLSGSADWLLGSEFRTRASVTHSFRAGGRTTYAIGLSRRFEGFSLGTTLSGSGRSDVRALMTLSLALGQEPRLRRWSASPRGIAGSGGVSARVFLDRDGDGVFRDGDLPLEGVRVTAGSSFRRARTDADGVAFVTGLTSHRPTTVRVETASLEDPFKLPTREAVAIVPRPGAVATLDFPVVMSGEVDGVVYLRDDDRLREAPAIEVELVDTETLAVERTTSAFDGFYLFDTVPPGDYRVRIRSDQPRVQDLRLPAPADVRIDPDGTIVSHVDLVLERE